ncbi:hypothetical protein [Paenibacillus massiliensis]|uniref:hypothetical protein n=1 Tax=Paenibacillus massiliensis TaxID=225917 RepID=UPI000410EE3F|nr:hypothetical protein [Paenibacillus massiliensis]
MQNSTEPSTVPASRRSERMKSPSVKAFLILWVVLIVAGIAATYLYSNHLKQEMLFQVQGHVDQQMAGLQAEYEQKFDVMSTEMDELQGKVDSLNELLTFTKDNASDKTDNSNKLYTQLAEVKKQLDTLQKKMDLLK